jgi:GT2 family glycosyltransferase
MNEPRGVSIVIPTWNGASLLAENLPSLRQALKAWGGKWELVIVDDAGQDETARVVQEYFPEAQLVRNDSNSGFSRTCNAGFALVSQAVVLCMNNDVRVSDGFLAPMLAHFDDPSVFAVTPNIIVEHEQRNQGIVRGLYGKGNLKGSFGSADEFSPVRENLYAIGACVAYDREKLLLLGGYSAELYTPYLFEDVDLSYRAWKRGLKSLYEPGGTVWHLSSATINRQGKRKKRTIYFCNRFIFHWSNLTEPVFLFKNIFFTILHLMFCWLWLDLIYYRAFVMALARIGAIRQARDENRRHERISDTEILQRTE